MWEEGTQFNACCLVIKPIIHTPPPLVHWAGSASTSTCCFETSSLLLCPRHTPHTCTTHLPPTPNPPNLMQWAGPASTMPQAALQPPPLFTTPSRHLTHIYVYSYPLCCTAVGWACINYHKLYRRPRGMFFSAQDRGEMVGGVALLVWGLVGGWVGGSWE